MLDVATEVTLELARFEREALKIVRERIAARQQGEAFKDIETESKPCES
jgi:hypothetical protein